MLYDVFGAKPEIMDVSSLVCSTRLLPGAYIYIYIYIYKCHIKYNCREQWRIIAMISHWTDQKRESS